MTPGADVFMAMILLAGILALWANLSIHRHDSSLPFVRRRIRRALVVGGLTLLLIEGDLIVHHAILQAVLLPVLGLGSLVAMRLARFLGP